MVDISRIRKEFTVFVIERDPTMAISLVETLKSVGYEKARFYPTLGSAQTMVATEAPHVLVIDHEGFETTLEKFLIDTQGISPETYTILTSTQRKFLDGLQFVSRSLAYDSIVRPFTTTLELVQKIDRACATLYYRFENEQMREEANDPDTEVDIQPLTAISGAAAGSSSGAYSVGEVISAGMSTQSSVRSFDAMNSALEKLSQTKDLDQTVQIFVEALSRTISNVPIAYFKYVPSHMTLLFAQAAWLPSEKFRGVGLDLKKESTEEVSQLAINPGGLSALRSLIREGFHKETFTAFSHVSDGEILGVFVVLDSVDLSENMTANILRRAFELAYKRNLTIKEKHQLDLTDPLTGLANRKQFTMRLEQEMARSRRILMPVSLITIDVDGFTELNKRLGAQQADSVLKTIAMILKRTTRLNDILARIGPDEFGCLLPHTGHEGAAIKAERLRILFESTKVPLLEGMGLGPIRVSVGVSEYPSICSDGDSLIATSIEALDQVRNEGGNKVCLASAPHGFQADFVPRNTDDSSQFGVRQSR